MCAGSLLYAYYAQFVLGKEPCPLCIAERIIIVATGLLGLIFAIHSPKGIVNKIYSIIIILITLFGVKIAVHHIWLMNLPIDQQPVSCGMPLNILFQRVTLNSFIHTVLQGDAECGKINWKILGMTGPEAVLLLCIFIIVLAGYNFVHKKYR